MTIRNLGLLVAVLLAASAPFPPVRAQDSGTRPAEASDHPISASGAEYASQCLLNGLRCKLVYGDTSEKGKAASSTASSQSKPLLFPQEPMINGPLAVAFVLVSLAVVIGLWMLFGNGGVLLSAAPRDVKKRQGEAPQSWHTSAAEAEEKPNEFLQRIAAMADRRQALVLLLRHCLLHAADVTETRLFRSDTERAVFARLPKNMPERERLANLLTAVELAHYGGRPVADNHFGVLLTAARGLLSSGRVANA